ncbi:MAG: GGDEF domain-containing protein [Acidobacteriota bacterium]
MSAEEALGVIGSHRVDLYVVSLGDRSSPGWGAVMGPGVEHPIGGCLVIGDDEEGADRAVGAGALGYLARPLREGDLRLIVRQVLERMRAEREIAQLRREATLLSIVKNASLTLDLEKLVVLLLDAALELGDAPAGSLLMRDETTGLFVEAAARGVDAARPGSGLFELPQEELEGILARREPVCLTAPAPQLAAMRLGDRPVETARVLPIVENDRGIGVLLLVSSRSVSPETVLTLARLATLVSPAVANALHARRTSELVIKDDLTDAFNRRYFESYLEDEIARSKRYGTHLSLIFLDLDNLKEVNNQHGHFVGSRILQEVAHRIILTVRGIDKVVRYGGDEFCVILPETEIEGANRVAERIRQAVARQPFIAGDGTSVGMTVSLGIASCPSHARNKEELVRKADKAMFQSKASAKNVVTVASL